MQNDYSPYAFGRSKLYVHSGSEEMSGAFSADEIAKANLRHDRIYGFTVYYPNVYSNVRRLPETQIGDIYDYWNSRNQINTCFGTKMDEVTKLRISASNKLIFSSVEKRMEVSKRMSERWSNPESRKKLMEGIKRSSDLHPERKVNNGRP
jgi:hypothetical protein